MPIITRAVSQPLPPVVEECRDTVAKIVWEQPRVTGMPIDMYELESRVWRHKEGLLLPSPWRMLARMNTLNFIATGMIPTLRYEFRLKAHTYAAELEAQWSVPSEPSSAITLRRRL